MRLGYAGKNKTLEDLHNIRLDRTLDKVSVLQNGLENGIAHLKQVGLKNLHDLEQVLRWNNRNNVKVFLLQTEIFPHAFDQYLGYSLEYASVELNRIGHFAKKHRQRLLFQIPSNIANFLLSDMEHERILFLRYVHYLLQMIQLMQLNDTCVLLLSFNAVSSENTSTLQMRLTELPERCLRRISLMNDPFTFSVADMQNIGQQLGIPVTINLVHDKLKPSTYDHSNFAQTWRNRNMRQLIIGSQWDCDDSAMLGHKLLLPQKVTSVSIEQMCKSFKEIINDCDSVILSQAFEQSILDVPATVPLHHSEDFLDIYKRMYREQIEILNDLP